MKFALITCSIAALATGFTTIALGQSLPENTGDSQRTGFGTTSKTASGASAEGTPNPENNTDEHDDTLYHGKTSESENPMMRDDGPLHFKKRPKERIHEVDSLKSLQSTGTDPKFQGSFITSGVSSINKVAEKPKPIEIGDAQLDQPRDTQPVKRHMTFPAEQDEKSDKAKTLADSSPSPTPSPSASPEKKKTTDANR